MGMVISDVIMTYWTICCINSEGLQVLQLLGIAGLGVKAQNMVKAV